MTRDDAIERFLSAVSDRCDADWAELEQISTSAEDHALVRNLRALRTIADHGAPLALVEAEAPKATWAHLTLLDKIGEGAYGEVHRAWDPKLSIDVALKLIPSQLASPEEALREGRMLARIRHENVARVYGVDHQDGFVGIWTEFVDGVTLKDVAREAAPLPEARLVATSRQLLAALAAIHDANILHRDLKPENVLLDKAGRVVVTDFGCGALRTGSGAAHRAQLAGTPRFWAPELFEQGTPTPGTDCYALGVLIYLLATGDYPVEAADVGALQVAHAQGKRRRLADARADLSPAFTAAVDRALEADPARRFRSAREWLETLDAPALVVRPATSRGGLARRFAWRPVLATAGVLATVAGVWWAASLNAPPLAFETELLRAHADGPFEKLAAGVGGPDAASVQVGDRLMLAFESSRTAHVYVINWDEEGRAYLLFPMDESELRNPLPGGTPHRLPGLVRGQPFAWEVSSAGRQEHFAVVTSADRLAEFERAIRETPRVQVEGDGTLPSAAFSGLLRGVGRAKSVEGTPGARPEDILETLRQQIDADPALRKKVAIEVLTVNNAGG